MSEASPVRSPRHGTSDRLESTQAGLESHCLAVIRHGSHSTWEVGAPCRGGAAEIVADLLRPGPIAPQRAALGDLRRYSSAVVPLEEVEQICRSFDVTINDVALSAVADSYRSGLLRRVSSQSRFAAYAGAGLSFGRPARWTPAGNRVSLMLPYLPVDVADPLQRLRVVHERLQTAKAAASVR